MVLVTEPHLRYSLSAFNTCFLEYISQFLSVPVRVQVFVRTPKRKIENAMDVDFT